MWSSKRASRIAELEAKVATLESLLADEQQIGQVLLGRCEHLAVDLKAAQNALLAEAGENGIRSEAIAHVREVIREATEGEQ